MRVETINELLKCKLLLKDEKGNIFVFDSHYMQYDNDYMINY